MSRGTQEVQNPPEHAIGVAVDLRFPDPQSPPAHFFQLARVLPVALHVSLDLGDPVGGVGAAGELRSPLCPVPAMPEVAVTKDREPSPWKDDVGLPGQVRDVLSEAGTGTPECAPQLHLATRVALPARAPSGGAGLRRGRSQTGIAGARTRWVPRGRQRLSGDQWRSVDDGHPGHGVRASAWVAARHSRSYSACFENCRCRRL